MPSQSQKKLGAALEILSQGVDANLHYAALDLRICLEILTLQKAESFAKYIPTATLKKAWQAPQLLKLLRQLDSMADQSFILHIAKQPGEGKPALPEDWTLVGEHKAIEFEWLRKNYNRLGSYLHGDALNTKEKRVEAIEAMKEIAKVVEDANGGSILGMAFAEMVTFQCPLCQQSQNVGMQYGISTGEALCMTPNCEAEFDFKMDGENSVVVLRAFHPNCLACKHTLLLEWRKAKHGMIINCPACQSQHLLTLGIKLVKDNSKPAAPASE